MKKNVVLTGLLAAMVFFTTAYILHIPIVGGGYVHLGDTMVYLAAALLPTPYAMLAAAIGGGLADVLTGAAVWALPTMIIKSVMALAFTAKKETLVCRRNVWALMVGALICVGGYYLAEIGILCLSGTAFSVAAMSAVAAIPFNALQGVASGVAFLLVGEALDHLQIKSRLQRIEM